MPMANAADIAMHFTFKSSPNMVGVAVLVQHVLCSYCGNAWRGNAWRGNAWHHCSAPKIAAFRQCYLIHNRKACHKSMQPLQALVDSAARQQGSPDLQLDNSLDARQRPCDQDTRQCPCSFCHYSRTYNSTPPPCYKSTCLCVSWLGCRPTCRCLTPSRRPHHVPLPKALRTTSCKTCTLSWPLTQPPLKSLHPTPSTCPYLFVTPRCSCHCMPLAVHRRRQLGFKATHSVLPASKVLHLLDQGISWWMISFQTWNGLCSLSRMQA